MDSGGGREHTTEPIDTVVRDAGACQPFEPDGGVVCVWRQIGPGTGVLTRGLLDAGALVTAIELVGLLPLRF